MTEIKKAINHFDYGIKCDIFQEPVISYAKTAISALEKQIPKKPNIHGNREGRYINTISYTCPVCNKHIGRDVYCKHCGQRLDWSKADKKGVIPNDR